MMEEKMRIYKELSFVGDKPALDKFKKIAPSFAVGDWTYVESKRMKDYIAFDYNGTLVPVTIKKLLQGGADNSWT